MRDKPNDPARLELIEKAISNIEEFLQGVDSFPSFASNKILCHAVIYNLQCVGENAYKLSRDFVSSHREVDWESIEGLRHVLCMITTQLTWRWSGIFWKKTYPI